MRREKQATELVPGARFRELGEDKTRLRRGRSNFSAVPSLFLSCRAPCDATKVHAPRIRGTLPASHTEYPGSDWIPFFLFQRLFVMERSTKKNPLQHFDLSLPTIERSLDNFSIFSSLRISLLNRLCFFVLKLFNKTRIRNYTFDP